MRRTLLWMVLVGGAVVATTRGAAPKIQKPVEYHHAGIVLAVPEGFEARSIPSPLDVMRAILKETGEPVISISSSAYPVGPKATPEAVADTVNTEIKGNLKVRNFKLLKRTKIRVAGIEGAAEMVTFQFSGEDSTAARVYFIRELKEAKVRICHVVTVEAPPTLQNRMLDVFGVVIRSVALIPPRHPSALGVKELGPPIRNAKLEFEIRPPRHWYTAPTPTGIHMGQMDYLRGQVTPLVRVFVMDLADESTAADCAKRDLTKATRADETRNVLTEVVSDGPTPMSGREGYGFVVRKITKGDVEEGVLPMYIAQRVACEPATRDHPRRKYGLAMIGQGKDPKKIEQMLARIASGFRFGKALATPTTTTAPATQPATVPASRPATAPAAGK